MNRYKLNCKFNSMRQLISFSVVLFAILLNSVYAQNSDLNPDILFKNIKNYEIDGSISPLTDCFCSEGTPRYGDYIINLRNKSLENKLDRKKVMVVFSYKVYEGSFLNENKKEYLFIASFNSDLFPRYIGDGSGLSILYIFDESFNQYPDVYIQDGKFPIDKIIDIDNDGISEVFQETFGGAQGYSITFLNVFKKDFNTPYFRLLTNYYSEDGFGKNYIKAYYMVENNYVILNSNLYIYNSKGKLIKTSQCVDKFRFDISGIEHEKAKNNVDWFQVFDEYPRYNSW